MRAHLLNGVLSSGIFGINGGRGESGCDIDVYKNSRTVRGPEGGGGDGGDGGDAGAGEGGSAVGASMATALKWLVANAPKLVDWIAKLLPFGPGYDSANGGEVARQLGPTGTNTLYTPMGQAYVDWIKKYAPDIWQNGNVWSAGPWNNSTWYDRYRQLVQAGMPEGVILDQNMVPVGIEAAAAAVAAQEEIRQAPRGPNETEIARLTLLGMDLTGINGTAAKEAAEKLLLVYKTAWSKYAYDVRDAWLLSNDLLDATNTGGNPFNPDGGSNTNTGGGGGTRPDTGGGTDPTNNANTAGPGNVVPLLLGAAALFFLAKR